jgi:ADP-ribosyl-[dinitrogen reductase] hydrolase
MSSDALKLRDRARGALVGLAVGDAIGVPLEFTTKDSRPPVNGMAGGGPFRLNPGEWTDDTSMALALAESLITMGGLDETDLMNRFCDWRDRGAYSHNGRCFDIGITVGDALARYRRSGDPVAGSTDPNAAGNGSLMRLAPVSIRYAFSRELCSKTARRQSATTHGALEAVEACAAYSELIREGIAGKTKAEVLSPRDGWSPKTVARAMSMETIGWSRTVVRGSGYVIHSLEASLWALGNANNFADAVLLAANLGEDSDTTAAITGQLAGAIWGLSGIPAEWLSVLAWRDEIIAIADKLHDQSLQEV